MKYIILCTVCLGTVLSAYVSSCTNIALPNIMAALNFDMDSIVWVTLSYLLPYGSTLPLTGKLGDRYGAKNVYVLGLVVFSLGSFFCGSATTSVGMIVFRVVQGLGAGMLLPNAMTIVVTTFGPHERGQALGMWSAMAAAGSALGPTVGGYLIENFDWRFIFFSVLPFCVISIILAFVLIPPSRQNPQAKCDFTGAAFLVVSLSALLIALNKGQKEGWDSLYIVVLFYIAAAVFIIFLLVELRVKHPMVEITLFKNVNFAAANLLGFISFATMFGVMFLLPFFLKSVLSYSSINAGMMMLPATVMMVFFAPLGGRIADRFGSCIPAFGGTMMIALAVWLLCTINADYGTFQFLTRLLLFGAGLGLTMSPLSSCAISSVSSDKVGTAAGVFNLFKIIGGSIGVASVETLLTNREIFHHSILNEAINAASHSPHEIFALIQAVWGNQGMNKAMVAQASHGWLTGLGFLTPQQYVTFQSLLYNMTARQSTIMAFEDVFVVLAWLTFAGGFLALLITKKKPSQPIAVKSD